MRDFAKGGKIDCLVNLSKSELLTKNIYTNSMNEMFLPQYHSKDSQEGFFRIERALLR